MKKRHHGASHHPKHRMAHHSAHNSASEMYSHDAHSNREYDGMINQDYRAIANMPQEVMMKPYPVAPGYLPEDLDDTIRGIDHQMSHDDRSAKGGLKPMKF